MNLLHQRSLLHHYPTIDYCVMDIKCGELLAGHRLFYIWLDRGECV